MAKNDGMSINRAVMLHLLNRMAEIGEFGVVQSSSMTAKRKLTLLRHQTKLKQPYNSMP